MKIKLVAFFSIFIFSGCVTSSYPLIKSKESVKLIRPGLYCLVKSGVEPTQESQCQWVEISENNNNGYEYIIYDDNYKWVKGSSGYVSLNTDYYARILMPEIKSGEFKGWNILQSCSISKRCIYFAVIKIEKGCYAIGHPIHSQDLFDQITVKTPLELKKAFLSSKKSVGQILYPGNYVEKKRANQKAKDLRDKKTYGGDL